MNIIYTKALYKQATCLTVTSTLIPLHCVAGFCFGMPSCAVPLSVYLSVTFIEMSKHILKFLLP